MFFPLVTFSPERIETSFTGGKELFVIIKKPFICHRVEAAVTQTRKNLNSCNTTEACG